MTHALQGGQCSLKEVRTSCQPGTGEIGLIAYNILLTGDVFTQNIGKLRGLKIIVVQTHEHRYQHVETEYSL